MANDLTAKAIRAAEWARKRMPYISAQETIHGIWNVYEQEPNGTGERLIWGQLSPGMLIGFCEDRGWQDQDSKGVESATVNQEQEADGVGWEPVKESAKSGDAWLTVWLGGPPFTWEVDLPLRGETKSGTAPTRAEARRQAVGAARGMNNENV